MSRSRRVKALLTKLDSDRRAGTDYFSNKFVGKVVEIFAGLTKLESDRKNGTDFFSHKFMAKVSEIFAGLTKLDSDRRNGTDYFGTKFRAKTESIFAGLPKPKEVGPFTRDDLPLLFTTDEVRIAPTKKPSDKKLGWIG